MCKKGLFAPGRRWRACAGGREGGFAHGKPRLAGPGGKKGIFAHGWSGRRRDAAAGGRVHPRTRAGGGPGGYKFPRSGDAVDVGRGRSERSERSPARCWQTAGKTSVTRSRGQEKPFCTRETAASRSRGQGGLFCTQAAAAGRSRGQRELFCTREGRETAGCGSGRDRKQRKKSKVFGNINFCHTFAVY